MSAPAEEKETGRIEAFSDGVFAIAITLLVLELKVPHLEDGGAGGSLTRALARQWPSYVALVTSFFTILVMWANHHAIFSLVRRVNAPFLYANGLLLLVVTVVPFPTALLAEYWQKPGAPVAAAVYAVTFAVSGLAYNLLWRTAISGRRLLRSTATEEKIQGISRSYWVGIPGYLVAAALAFIDIHITIGICVALLVVWILVSVRRLEE